MADKIYSSIIDAFLDDREPNWKDLGLTDAKKSGEEQLERTHEYVDKDFMDDIAESASHHTSIPSSSKVGKHRNTGETVSESTLVGSVKSDWRKDAAHPEDYKSKHGDDGLVEEITMSIETAEKDGTVEKKEVSDGEIQRYIRDLLNMGTSPSKVAAKLEKLAEIELFNKQMATRYLQDNAGLVGMAYLEPNTYMPKNSPTYEHKAGASNDCVRQQAAWKSAGVTPHAKSVKQVKACQGCSFFAKNGNQKTCNLYHLPVVGNQQELGSIINKITAGVPAASKKAALENIANRVEQQVQPKSASEAVGRASEFTHERPQSIKKGSNATSTLDGAGIMKLHVAGAALQRIYQWADKRFGSFATGRAMREFTQALKKNASGQIVLAQTDADFLKKLGIHNEAFTGAVKCGSCVHHSGKTFEVKTASDEGIKRTPQKFVEATPETVRAANKRAAVPDFNANVVEKLHVAGHSLEKIYNAGVSKVGSVQASKAVKAFVSGLKHKPIKVALSQIDCSFLKNKLAVHNAIIGAEKCASCTFRSGMHCGLTGGTLLSFPGMDKQASNHKIASDAPKDGYAIMNEYDMTGAAKQADIDMTPPERAEIQISNRPTLDME